MGLFQQDQIDINKMMQANREFVKSPSVAEIQNEKVLKIRHENLLKIMTSNEKPEKLVYPSSALDTCKNLNKPYENEPENINSNTNQVRQIQ